MDDTIQNAELLHDDPKDIDLENSGPNSVMQVPRGTMAVQQPAGEITPLTMLNTALEKGLSGDQLEKFMDLHERWEAGLAKKAYVAAMSKVQAELPTVLKDSENKQTNSRYATEEAISKTIKPVYTKYGFSLSFDIGETQLTDHIRVLCDIAHKKGHVKIIHIDYPYDTTGIKGTVNKTQIHGYKSTVSYAKNTLICMAFNVATGDDDDGNAAGMPEYITEDQAAKLMLLAEEVGADKKKFCQYMGVVAIPYIRASDHQKALSGLEAKRGK